jgi:DNA-binding response OmpR family regulator
MSKIKIVLIEDEEILSKVLSLELQEAGFDVTLAEDGEAGLAAVKKVIPSLVLLDLVLPKKHGFEVLSELKKSPKTKKIPVIILSALGSVEDMKKGLGLGAKAYLVKSQHGVGEIVSKVKEYLGGKIK